MHHIMHKGFIVPIFAGRLVHGAVNPPRLWMVCCILSPFVYVTYIRIHNKLVNMT